MRRQEIYKEYKDKGICPFSKKNPLYSVSRCKECLETLKKTNKNRESKWKRVKKKNGIC